MPSTSSRSHTCTTTITVIYRPLSKLPDAVVVVPYGAGYLRTRGGLSNVETPEVRRSKFGSLSLWHADWRRTR